MLTEREYDDKARRLEEALSEYAEDWDWEILSAETVRRDVAVAAEIDDSVPKDWGLRSMHIIARKDDLTVRLPVSSDLEVRSEWSDVIVSMVEEPLEEARNAK